MIPCFVHLLGQSKELKLPSDLKEEALQCLLVKAGFEAAYCGQDLSYAERLLREDPGIPRYLEVALSYRQSVLARLSADYSTSHAYINKVLSSTENDEPDRRFNTWQIYLKLSQLKNLTMQEEFVKAHRELTAWETPPVQSLMEGQAQISYSLVAFEIDRSLGKLDSAGKYLANCYYHFSYSHRHDPRVYQVVCALVDIHCALGKINAAETLLSMETKTLPVGLSKGRRRLLVSSLEVYIARGSESSFTEARSIINQLDDFYRKKDCLDISDQQLHVRTLVASARVYHLQSSFTRSVNEWERVKDLASRYSAFRGRRFTVAFSELSIGYARMKLALQSLETANAIFIHEKDNFWIPVIATHWLPMIRAEIANLLRCKSCTKCHMRHSSFDDSAGSPVQLG